MHRRNELAWVPGNGHTLIVGIGARISCCVSWREMSLDDQVDHAKDVVTDLYDGTVEFRVIADRGSPLVPPA